MIFLRDEDIQILDFINIEFEKTEELSLDNQDCLRYNDTKEKELKVTFADWNRSIENLIRYGFLIEESNAENPSFTLLQR